MSESIYTVKAENVIEGDSLVGIDNGYVFEDPETDPNVTLPGGGHGYAVSNGYVLIGFHDRNGDENYLLVLRDHPIDVKREDKA